MSASVRAVAARIALAKRCLTSKGLHVTGGLVLPQQGPSSPDGELITAGAFIAFYTDARQAQRLEPEVKQNAARFHGRVVRHGAMTLVLVHPPASGLRQTASECALG
jgi:hypothetical protein